MYQNQNPNIEKELVIRKLRSNLSKLTIEKKDIIVKKLIEECKHYFVLEELSKMIIEKASYESNFVAVYATLCHDMKEVSVPVKLWFRTEVVEDTKNFPQMLSLHDPSVHQSPVECSQFSTVPIDILCHIAHFLWKDYFDLAPLLLVCSDWNKAIKEMASNPRLMSFKKVLLKSLNYHLEHHFSKPIEPQLSNPNTTNEELHLRKIYKMSLLSFVGELYVLDMIKKKLLEKVSQYLLQRATDGDLEMLMTLLFITGKKWEEENESGLDIIFSVLYDRSVKPFAPGMQSNARIRFTIVELFELRSAKWPVKRHRRIL